MLRPIALIAFVCLCAVAARASASPAPMVFHLTVSGTATARWDHTESRIGTCSSLVRAQGTRTVRFRSVRPVLVTFAGGHLAGVAMTALAGTAAVSGHNTVTQDCGGPPPQPVDQVCQRVAQRFNSGHVSLSSAGTGQVKLGAARLAVRRTECPLVPDDVAATPLGPLPRRLRLSPTALANARFAKLTLSAATKGGMTYGDPESGSSVQRASWKLVFVRIHP
jgi:hypothetical protein